MLVDTCKYYIAIRSYLIKSSWPGIEQCAHESSKINMQLAIIAAVAFLLFGGAKAQQQQAQDGGRWITNIQCKFNLVFWLLEQCITCI